MSDRHHDYKMNDYTHQRYLELRDVEGVVVQRIGKTKAGTKWRILRNAAGLRNQDLAIICSEGYLPFGFRVVGDIILIEERRI